MSRYNSGGHNRTHDYEGRYKRLDSFKYNKYVPILKQIDKDVESLIQWTNGESIEVVYNADYLGVRYTAGKEEVREKLYFESVSNNYGGADRIYFICPNCADRCRFLYLHQRHFKCRKCANLNYLSQQTTKMKLCHI